MTAEATLPQPLDLIIYQGDDYSTSVTATISLTGGVATALIYQAPLVGTVLPANATPAAAFTCSISAETITLELPNSQSAALSGNYVWDVQVVLPGNIIHTIAAGKLIAKAQVTV
jgi:hypothetical protein